LCTAAASWTQILEFTNRKTPSQSQYEADSAPALALKATIERTENRFANYAKAGLLCGNDGLPHLISDPGLALKYGHAGEVFVST
jgi:photosystem I subunit 3